MSPPTSAPTMAPQVFSPPIQPNAAPQPQPQTPMQQQAASSMPPPTAPASNSKPTDPSDLADALTSAGIDLKEEEARLASFSAAGPSSLGAFGGGQYANTGIKSEEELSRIIKRRQTEQRSNHMIDPFLDPRVLSNRLFRKTRSENMAQFSLRDQNSPNPGVVGNGPQSDIATLLSLACRDRLHSLLTRSVYLAKARRRPHTQVTGEWANSVRGVTPETRNPDSAISPRGNRLKRSFSSANNLPPPTPNPLPSTLSTSLSNETAKALRALKQREWEADQERIRKKTKREHTGGGATASGPGTPGTGDVPTLATPGAESTPAAGERKLSAKESRKQQATKLEEVTMHRNANATANMMMGGFGGSFGGKKKKKTYSWMNAGGAGPGAASPMAGSPRPGTPGAGGAADPAAAQNVAANDINWMGQRFGVWREDGERGKGVQIRDWIGALEGDGRVGGKGISKAYMRLK